MWPHALSSLIGIWLMAAPAVFNHLGQPAEINDRIAGPLIATFSCVAVWECSRSLRWVSFAIGLWLIPSAFIIGYTIPGAINTALAGAAIAGLSLIQGKLKTPYGGGWSALWKKDPYGSAP